MIILNKNIKYVFHNNGRHKPFGTRIRSVYYSQSAYKMCILLYECTVLTLAFKCMQCEFMRLCIQFLPLQMTIYSSFFPFYRLQLPPFMETLKMKWNETKPNEIQWNRLIHLYWYQVANVWTGKVFSYMNRNETLKMWWKDKVWIRQFIFAAATTFASWPLFHI